MHFGPSNTPKPAIVIEYDARGTRASKTFANALAARRFYVAKLNANKNPTIKKG